MKKLTLSILLVLLSAPTVYAQSAPSGYAKIAACFSQNVKFDLLRDKQTFDKGYLVFRSEKPLRINRVPVAISYTNAGARAIVQAKSLPQLILIGTMRRPFDIVWSGKQWLCNARF